VSSAVEVDRSMVITIGNREKCMLSRECCVKIAGWAEKDVEIRMSA